MVNTCFIWIGRLNSSEGRLCDTEVSDMVGVSEDSGSMPMGWFDL